MTPPELLLVRTPTLEIACEASGPEDGPPVILLHGFPDDVRTWDDVAAPLAADGCRVLVPYLRGYGPTRYLNDATMRSGQQAALGSDLRGLMDGLGIASATLAGYDWGGRAACVVAALWPDRVRGLVSVNGYNIQAIAASGEPADAAREYRYWYQWYFHTERGRAGLDLNRRDLCRLLWRLWSPNWAFDEPTFERTAASWDNPDFVATVIHSYRHRFRAAAGDLAFEGVEQMLADRPAISVPTIVLHGEADGVDPPASSERAAARFTGPFERRVILRAGHFLPREAPEAIVDALRKLMA